jgi:hypothetical protein
MIERLSPFRLPPKPNRAARRRAARGLLTAVLLGLLATTVLPTGSRALTVFDPLNYQEDGVWDIPPSSGCGRQPAREAKN